VHGPIGSDTSGRAQAWQEKGTAGLSTPLLLQA